jgi:hypothetical protein
MNNSLKTILCNIAYSPIGDFIVTHSGLNRLWAELHVHYAKKRLLAQAAREYENGSSWGSLGDYKEALKKHWVSYSEYAHQYAFYNLSEEQRDEFVARLKMAYFYYRYVPGVVKPFFRNKNRFLKKFNNFIHREWLYVPESSFAEFEELLSKFDCIIKPSDGKLGRGVFKVRKNDSSKSIKELWDYCVKHKSLVEQCIESCEELKVFHPQSLNTVRVVTVSNKEKSAVFGSFLRTGVGDSIVDNAHAGGLFAQIDIQNGIIESEGIDVNGARLEKHPDTGIMFKGYRIPHWDLIVKTCCEAAKETGNPITGWDVAVNNKEEVELVEGNYGPDFDVMQSPLRIGVKKILYSWIDDYLGIEMK